MLQDTLKQTLELKAQLQLLLTTADIEMRSDGHCYISVALISDVTLVGRIWLRLPNYI